MNWKKKYKFLLEQQAREQAWSASQAEKQMQFQHYESSTAHQREVADLQAAGLNPVLSSGGTGASTGSGAQAQADSILPELMQILQSSVSHGGGGRTVVNVENGDEKTYKEGEGEYGVKYGRKVAPAHSVTSATSKPKDDDKVPYKEAKRNYNILKKDISAELDRFMDTVRDTKVNLSVSSNCVARAMTRSTLGEIADDLGALKTLASNSGKAVSKAMIRTHEAFMKVVNKEVNKLPKDMQKNFWNDYYR